MYAVANSERSQPTRVDPPFSTPLIFPNELKTERASTTMSIRPDDVRSLAEVVRELGGDNTVTMKT
jgi:hypothetical protein